MSDTIDVYEPFDPDTVIEEAPVPVVKTPVFNSFDPNMIDEPPAPVGAATWPVFKNAMSIEDYSRIFSQGSVYTGDEPGSVAAFMKSTIEMSKATPPDLRSFGQTSNIMPDPQAQNVLPWPGLVPQMLKALAEQHVGPNLIIGLRIADIMRYSNPSTRPWLPGWSLSTKEGAHTPTAQDKKDIADATLFLQNCSSETDTRKRGAMGYTSFQVFLETLVRDAMIYGAYAVWTDATIGGYVKGFKAVSAYNVRLCAKEGYNNEPSIYAVGVDETNKVKYKWTRYDLAYRPRNPRADASVGGYGQSEIEIALKFIQGYSEALELNLSTFSKSAIPPGILMASGMWTPKQLDVLSRLWTNLKRGVTKQHALPVIPLPKEGKLELLALDALQKKDAQFQDFINMVGSALCIAYKFPPQRLGYRVSGAGPDSKPDPQVVAANVDIADPGLAPDLMSLESVINDYLISPKWPHLNFNFTCKSPKDDARAYEMKMLAMTVDERRAYVDLPTLEDVADKKDRDLARIVGLSPVDPGLASMFTSIATAQIAAASQASLQETKPDGAAFPAKRDPGKSLDHGHEGGVRRDSSAERKAADK